MAINQLYNKGREGFLDGSIDWDTDDIRVALVETGYTFNAAHDYVDDVATYITVASERSTQLQTPTKTDGVADAADITLTAVTTGKSIIGLIIYKYNAADAAARLILYSDTYTGIPFTTSGADVTITWDNGANKIFKL